MGAWIETQNVLIIMFCFYVAPPVGAWIETVLCHFYNFEVKVAPPVGAWIETPTDGESFAET